jgi:MFS transporter, AAHS family, 4-hydroxybenzoate transporter
VYGGVLPIVIALLAFWGIPKTSAPASAAVTKAPAQKSPSRVGLLFTRKYRARTALLWAVNATNLFANYGFASWLPTLLVQDGWTLAAASRVMAVMAIGSVSGSYIVSMLADRGRIALGFGGAYLIAAAALAICATNPDSIWIWVGLLIMIGFGAVGSMLTLGPLASTLYPAEARSTGVGWANGFGRAGSLFGPLALAWLINQKLPPTQVIGVLMIPMLICMLLMLVLAGVVRAKRQEEIS